MIRSRLMGLVAVAGFFFAIPAQAKLTRQDVPKGQVTGLEMSIEGTLQVTPGGELRWFVTVYEIVKGRDIRPATGVELKALASFHRQAPVAESLTDRRGRASLSFPIPETITGSFELVVEARSSKKIRREFDVHVQVGPRYRTELFVDRKTVPPGGSVHAWGRVIDLASNLPSAHHELRLTARLGGSLVGRGHELRTNEQGLFQAELRAPETSASFSVTAHADKAVSVSRTLSAAHTAPPSLLVYARPDVSVVAPGTRIEVEVAVRAADGRPVPNASLTGLSIPVSGDDKKVAPVLTDSKGRARVPWEVSSTAEIATVVGEVRALKEGQGVGTGKVRVRASRVPLIVSWAVEGAALIPGAPSRVFVRAFHPDGRPWSGLPARLESARLSAGATSTDADGVAVFEASVAPARGQAPSSCAGPTLAAVRVHLGPHDKLLCLPVDPDASLRVRSAPSARPGTQLAVELSPRATIASAPVSLTLLAKGASGNWRPLAQRTVKAGRREAALSIPKEARGPLWIRARPLVGGGLEVRGGSALTWASPREGFDLAVGASASGTVTLTSSGAGNDAGTGFAIAVPTDRGAALLAELQSARGRGPEGTAESLRWQGFLAARTPLDHAAPAVLRDGSVTALAMPEDPVAFGLLRDPWRTRERFVRGRLGRLLLAIEHHVEASLPGRLQDVAVQGPRGWRFNTEILNAIAADLGLDAVAALDGSPLTMEALQALDKNISYDHVAARITRERLLRVLVGLRELVHAEGLDYRWARRGDPRGWLRGLDDWMSANGGVDLLREHLFDGWGRPLAIRKARGGRARFRFLEPVVGYELVSAGPDGRFGTRDDLFDPFARVLPARSLYGEAVGEDALLARLRGVELGRATIAVLSEAFEVDPPSWQTSEPSTSSQSWNAPGLVDGQEHALRARAVGPLRGSSAAFRAMQRQAAQIQLPLSSDPRLYTIVAGRYARDGSAAFATETLSAGVPLLVDADIPNRLRPNEPLRVPLRLTGLGARQALSVRVESRGPVDVRVIGKTELSVREGETRELVLEMRARGVGKARVSVLVAGADGRAIQQLSRELSIMWDGSLRAQHTGAMIDSEATLTLEPPMDARPVRSFLVVAAPLALLRDPDLQRLGRRHPEVLAWAYALRGEPLPAPLRRALSGRRGESTAMPALTRACSGAAWSAIPDSPAIDTARRKAMASLQSLRAPAGLRERSALLVALASSATALTRPGTRDSVARLVGELRNDGWHAPLSEKSRPSVMARLAAGLLLADAKDLPGRELYELASAALIDGEHGGKVLPGEKKRAVDGWIGTIALAIAARQLGEHARADELARGIAPRFYLGMRGDVESGFWLLAGSVYGAFGVGGPARVAVEINGERRRLPLRRGQATLPLPSGKLRVVVKSSQAVVARLEARYVRPVKTTTGSALTATLTGDLGATSSTAALEAKVSNESGDDIARPVLEIVLPSAARLSATSRRSIEESEGVVRVTEPDSLGLVRIYLRPIASKQTVRVPVPLRWIAAGQVTGLSVSIYDAEKPWRRTASPSRTIRLDKPPEERWQ